MKNSIVILILLLIFYSCCDTITSSDNENVPVGYPTCISIIAPDLLITLNQIYDSLNENTIYSGLNEFGFSASSWSVKIY